MSRRFSWIGLVGTLSLLLTLPFGVAKAAQTPANAMVSHSAKSDAAITGSPYRVMIIGSSVADGWKDDRGGYLRRAFRALSVIDHTNIVLVNHAIPGLGAGVLNRFYPGWLATADSQAVVIAWGGLDDAYEHTPLPLFADMIRQEISEALADNNVVMVITPPISKASYTQYRILQPLYLGTEMRVAQEFHSPDVYVFNVFGLMKRYLYEHDQTYVPYMADGWHPNARGHKLAGQLLLMDMLRHFGTEAIPLDSLTSSAAKESSRAGSN